MTTYGGRRISAADAPPSTVAFVLALALLAACGDGDHRPASTPTQAPPRTATPSATSAADLTPTATPLGSATATKTPLIAPTTASATATATATGVTGGAVLSIGSAVGLPGQSLSVSVTLTGGGDVAGTQNDIGFTALAPIGAKANGLPDCSVDPSINKRATTFSFRPPNCIFSSDCTAVRAIVLAFDNVDPIAVGSTLYTCRVAIAEDAHVGTYPLTCAQAAASDPEGHSLATTCSAGEIDVSIPTATPTESAPTATAGPPSPSPSATPTQPSGAEGAMPPLAAAGRWFVDALGRVVLVHGVNMVAKREPFYPAAFGFGDDDAAFLAGEGFTAVRLGVDFRGLMPTPGVVEGDYVDHLAETVTALTAHGLFVLIDFHQDGFSPMFNGNGLPDWLAITDGLPNPPGAVFPLYYIQNPAMQRAFENFWADREGPNGIGLQEYFLQGVAAVVARFADEPRVLGTELMNEPWPGADWAACLLQAGGCPEIEAQRLVPFYQRGAAAARSLAPAQLVFVEPFVLFNFGQTDTSIPGPDERLALSFHSYAQDVASEEGVVARANAAAERDQRPLLCTEFGASTDPVLLNRLTAEMEQGLVPWLFWSYDESIMTDLQLPAGPEHVRSPEALAALVRPYPIATAGTPTAISFDPTSNELRFAYDSVGPSGVVYPSEVLTVISVPARHYPNGYAVTVEGAEVTSAPGAALLTLRTLPGAQHVSVGVAPAM